MKVISPSLALPRSNAFPMLVIPSSITKVWARTQHAPSFGAMQTAVRLHLRNQTMYLPTVSFRVLPSYVLWAYFINLSLSVDHEYEQLGENKNYLVNNVYEEKTQAELESFYMQHVSSL